jgi:uncharacterized metal-binding protein YceD (DUF177 family)
MAHAHLETGRYNIAPIGVDQGLELDLDQTTPWLAQLLDELEEQAEAPSQKRKISFRGTLEKKHKGAFKEYLLLTGIVSASYATLCVSTGSPMTDSLEVEVHAVFIDQALEKEMELEEETELFINDDQYDLYYFDKKSVDLKSAISEYIFLNINHYPRLEASL